MLANQVDANEVSESDDSEVSEELEKKSLIQCFSIVNIFESWPIDNKQSSQKQEKQDKKSRTLSQTPSQVDSLSINDKDWISKVLLFVTLGDPSQSCQILNIKVSRYQHIAKHKQDKDGKSNVVPAYIKNTIKLLHTLVAIKNSIYEAKKQNNFKSLLNLPTNISTSNPLSERQQTILFLRFLFHVKKNAEQVAFLKYTQKGSNNSISINEKLMEDKFASSLEYGIQKLTYIMSKDKPSLDFLKKKGSFINPKTVNVGDTPFRATGNLSLTSNQPITVFVMCLFKYFDWFLKIVYRDMSLYEIYEQEYEIKEDLTNLKNFLVRFLLLIFWNVQKTISQNPSSIKQDFIDFILKFLSDLKNINDDDSSIIKLLLDELFPLDMF